MSTKRRLMEKANKRLLNESLPAPINFTEQEALAMLCKLIDYDMGGKGEMPEKLVKVFQDALRAKGRNLDGPNNVPDGAYL